MSVNNAYSRDEKFLIFFKVIFCLCLYLIFLKYLLVKLKNQKHVLKLFDVKTKFISLTKTIF